VLGDIASKSLCWTCRGSDDGDHVTLNID